MGVIIVMFWTSINKLPLEPQPLWTIISTTTIWAENCCWSLYSKTTRQMRSVCISKLRHLVGKFCSIWGNILKDRILSQVSFVSIHISDSELLEIDLVLYTDVSKKVQHYNRHQQLFCISKMCKRKTSGSIPPHGLLGLECQGTVMDRP